MKGNTPTIALSCGGAVCAAVLLLVAATVTASAQTAYVYTLFSIPGTMETYPAAIDGSNIVGSYETDSGDTYGFLYNTVSQTYMTLSETGAASTYATGISGNYIVGQGTGGFLYNISSQTYTTLSDPSADNADSTWPTGISDNDVAGYYYGFVDGSGYNYHGFVYNIVDQTYEDVTVPPELDTHVTAISSGQFVGVYYATNGTQYCFLSGLYTTLTNFPGWPNGISGDYIVGTDSDTAPPQSFIYEISSQTYVIFNVPVATGGTSAEGIDGGGNIVGYCTLSYGGHAVGFLAQPVWTQPARPVLNVSISDGNLLITWPANFSGFDLREKSGLSVAGWTMVTNSPAIVNGQYQVVIPGPLAASCFYWLQSE